MPACLFGVPAAMLVQAPGSARYEMSDACRSEGFGVLCLVASIPEGLCMGLWMACRTLESSRRHGWSGMHDDGLRAAAMPACSGGRG